jgi:hypothetical protein
MFPNRPFHATMQPIIKNRHALSDEAVLSGPVFSHELVKTCFGEAAVVWCADRQGPRIVRVFLPAPLKKTLRDIHGMFPGSPMKSCGTVAKLGKALRTFLE